MKRKDTPPQCRTKIYGSAITFYEEYPEEGLTEEQREGLHLAKYRAKSERQIFSNKCICVLSQWPFFGAFEQFLFFLHKRQGRETRQSIQFQPRLSMSRFIHRAPRN